MISKVNTINLQVTGDNQTVLPISFDFRGGNYLEKQENELPNLGKLSSTTVVNIEASCS